MPGGPKKDFKEVVEKRCTHVKSSSRFRGILNRSKRPQRDAKGTRNSIKTGCGKTGTNVNFGTRFRSALNRHQSDASWPHFRDPGKDFGGLGRPCVATARDYLARMEQIILK